jgi:hypothetical protein
VLTASVDPGQRHELTLLVLSRYPLVVIEGAEESRVSDLVEQVALDLGLPLLEWSSSQGLVRRGIGPIPDTRDPDRALRHLLEHPEERLVHLRDLHPYFDRAEVVRHLREAEQRAAPTRSALILSGASITLPAELVPLAASLRVSLPGPRELDRLLRGTVRELEAQRRTAIALDDDGRRALVEAMRGLHLDEARRALYRVALADGRLDSGDAEGLREDRRRRLQLGSQLEWIEPVSGLDALGGAPHFKRWVGRRKDAFSEAARRFGVEEPRGLLLVGIPGTGKSLACRALAGEWELPLLRLDPGRLYDKFVGESEANLRRALASAEAMAPSVLWLDEIEKALASGGGVADDGLSQRMLGTFLTWLQERPAPVFVLATANDVSRLPMELLRRGRFDEVFFVDLPSAEERARILAIHLERRGREPGQFPLEELAEACEGFTGAELEGVVVAALYHAFSERKPLAPAHLRHEIDATRPLSRLRPAEIDALRRWGHQHAVLA